jgi:hypothetical protein
MRKYTVLTTATGEARQIVIEDDRHPEDLAAALHQLGYINTKDVTSAPTDADDYFGSRIVLVHPNVISIKLAPS